jgi:hypothetical protein
MSQSKRLIMDIAGVVVAVDAPGAWMASLTARYEAFLCDLPPAWHVTLRHDPALQPEESGWAEHDEFRTRFHIYATAGWIDLRERRGEVRTVGPERAFSAVERTLVYICMQALPREHAGLLLHACGVVRHGAGHVFVGPSGAGKTTVAQLAAGYGQVLSDENVVLRANAPGPELWSTPFWGFSTPPEIIARVRVTAPLRAVFILAQAPGFTLTPLTPGQAVLALLSSEKVAVERPTSADAWLAAAQRLVAQTPVYRLGFRPTPELWEFLGELPRQGPVARPVSWPA